MRLEGAVLGPTVNENTCTTCTCIRPVTAAGDGIHNGCPDASGLSLRGKVRGGLAMHPHLLLYTHLPQPYRKASTKNAANHMWYIHYNYYRQLEESEHP